MGIKPKEWARKVDSSRALVCVIAAARYLTDVPDPREVSKIETFAHGHNP
jgi:hypothetical protein